MRYIDSASAILPWSHSSCRLFIHIEYTQKTPFSYSSWPESCGVPDDGRFSGPQILSGHWTMADRDQGLIKYYIIWNSYGGTFSLTFKKHSIFTEQLWDNCLHFRHNAGETSPWKNWVPLLALLLIRTSLLYRQVSRLVSGRYLVRISAKLHDILSFLLIVLSLSRWMLIRYMELELLCMRNIPVEEVTR